jgi:tripartite-type tricarboxylate transporter receptor subunit TctC
VGSVVSQRRKTWSVPVFLFLSILLPLACFGQAYPSKPIKIVVPLAAGGTGDTLGRLVGEELGKALRAAVIVENRPGSGGIIGTEAVARSAADGYTLMHTSASHIANAALRPKLPYDAIKDFAVIARTADTHQLVVAHPSFPPNTLQELIQYCKANRVFYGSSGNGSSTHLNMELLKSLAAIPMEHVPYKGSTQSRTDLIAGQIQLSVDGLVPTLPHIRAGKLKAIALASSRRSVVAPDIPTIAEAGVPAYQTDTWYALYAPAGVPAPILERLRSATRAALESQGLREKMLHQGAEPTDPSPALLEKQMREDYARWTKLVHDAKLKID